LLAWGAACTSQLNLPSFSPRQAFFQVTRFTRQFQPNDWTQTFWRNPQYGAVLLVTQTSYVTRAPWFVALGAPKNAHLMMGYVSLRYVLP
jgi:hypothetical protein